MTAPTPNAELADAGLAMRIRDVLLQFNWSNFGLDLVDDAETEWAGALAEDLVAEVFGPRPDAGEGGSLTGGEPSPGTGCRCDWLGEGTPEHAASPLCRSLRPNANREEMQPPPCADHESSELGCPVCTAQRRAFYAALGRGDDVPPNAESAS